MAKVQLNGVQVKFLKDMLELTDGQDAMQKFMQIMKEEGLDPTMMPEVVDHCIKAFANRSKK